MDNKKDNAYYIRKIVTDLRFLIAHTQELTRENMEEDEVLSDCIMFRLVQISENSVRLTEEFKRRYSEIPWMAIKGLRNRIVHEYGEVDLSIVYDTVKNDVPFLLERLEYLI